MSAFPQSIPLPRVTEPPNPFATALDAANTRYLNRLDAHLKACATALREELFTQLRATVTADHIAYEGPRAVTVIGGYRFTVDCRDDSQPLLRVEVLCPTCGERGWSQVVIGYEGLAEAIRKPSVSQHFCDAGRAW